MSDIQTNEVKEYPAIDSIKKENDQIILSIRDIEAEMSWMVSEINNIVLKLLMSNRIDIGNPEKEMTNTGPGVTLTKETLEWPIYTGISLLTIKSVTECTLDKPSITHFNVFLQKVDSGGISEDLGNILTTDTMNALSELHTLTMNRFNLIDSSNELWKEKQSLEYILNTLKGN